MSNDEIVNFSNQHEFISADDNNGYAGYWLQKNQPLNVARKYWAPKYRAAITQS
jgi:hypothetical protein